MDSSGDLDKTLRVAIVSVVLEGCSQFHCYRGGKGQFAVPL